VKNRFILSPSYMGDALPALNHLAKADWEINAPLSPEEDKQSRMSAIHQALADGVGRTVREKLRPVSIAGDCCTAIGVLAGLQRAGIDPMLVWFDAHGDFNTWETSPSGFIGGMPLAMMVGRGDQTMPQAVGLRALPEERVLLTDARDLDPAERELLAASKLVHLPDAEALLSYPLPSGPLYVHFDTDIVVLKESPAHNFPAQGGPSSTVIRSVFERLAQSGQVVAVSLSAWNPDLDRDHKSENVSLSLLQTLVSR
jgi:arginase